MGGVPLGVSEEQRTISKFPNAGLLLLDREHNGPKLL
jgi:hypothetical protein